MPQWTIPRLSLPQSFTSAFLSQLVLARFKDTVIQRLSLNHICKVFFFSHLSIHNTVIGPDGNLQPCLVPVDHFHSHTKNTTNLMEHFIVLSWKLCLWSLARGVTMDLIFVSTANPMVTFLWLARNQSLHFWQQGWLRQSSPNYDVEQEIFTPAQIRNWGKTTLKWRI